MPPDPDDIIDLPGRPSRSWWDRIEGRVQVQRIAVLAVVLGVWHLLIRSEVLSPLYTATPVETLNRFLELPTESLFWVDVITTLRESLLGWTIGSLAGLATGLLIGRWVHGSKVLNPFLTFVNAVPKVALAPLFILWFGIGETSKVVTAALVVFFIVQVPTSAAVSLVNPDLDMVARTMGANERQRFLKVYLPGTLPAVFGALRLGAVYALLTAVFTEFLAARRGLGQRLVTATNQFNVDDAFAIMVFLALLALAMNGAVGLVERRFLRWRGSGSSGQVVSL